MKSVDGPPANRAIAPNPFNPRTTISFDLDRTAWVRLDVFDPRGRLVVNLLDRVVAAGGHDIVWNGLDRDGNAVSSGVYACRLSLDGRATSARMSLVR